MGIVNEGLFQNVGTHHREGLTIIESKGASRRDSLVRPNTISRHRSAKGKKRSLPYRRGDAGVEKARISQKDRRAGE